MWLLTDWRVPNSVVFASVGLIMTRNADADSNSIWRAACRFSNSAVLASAGHRKNETMAQADDASTKSIWRSASHSPYGF